MRDLDEERRYAPTVEEGERLVGAVTFFASKLGGVHPYKLCWLLYALDFSIFRETGCTVTGLTYYAVGNWNWSPLPSVWLYGWSKPSDIKAIHIDDWTEASDAQARFRRCLTTIIRDGEPSMQASETFDSLPFTLRQLGCMEIWAEEFRDVSPRDIQDPIPGTPWTTTRLRDRRIFAPIDYELALDGSPGTITPDQAREIASERREAGLLFDSVGSETER